MTGFEMNRRNFLKGAAVGLAGVGAASFMAACTPSNQPAASDASAEPAGRSWESAPAAIADADIVETLDFDVVVVGAGVAGGATFMRAAEGGAKAALVEKMDTFSARGMDNAAIGTRKQQEAGIVIDKAKVVNDLVTAGGYKVNGSLIKLWADQSGRVYDDITDMVEAQGYTVALTSVEETNMDADGFWNRTYPVTHLFGVAELGNGAAQQNILSSMIDRGIAAGGEVFYSTPGEQLVTDDSGAVVAVICKREDGYVRFNASKGVVLACGDYSGNQDMVDEWDPILNEAQALIYTPIGANTGDHVNMAYWAGGQMQKCAAAHMVHPIMGGGACGTYSFLRVNKDGGRFCNEDTPLPGITNAFMVAPNHVVWTVFDADFISQLPQMSKLSQYNGTTSGPDDPSLGITPEESMKNTLESGQSVTADSVEGLAEAMGVPADALAATVARYNELAEKGVDEDFGKDAANLFPIVKAPFYASKVNAVTLVCTGGLDVDSNLNVCNADGLAIQGLYAVGNSAGNFFSNEYPMSCPGISHGRAITLGYVLGEALAADTTVQAI